MTAPETFASLKSILDQGAPSRHEVMRTNGQVRKPKSTSARKQRASMMGQGTVADATSGPAGLAPPQQAEDMTAPETFASLKSILDQGAPSRHEVDGAHCLTHETKRK